MYNIYKLTNIIDGKSYIGQTKRSVSTRINEHKFSSKKRQISALHTAINDFGINSFSVQTLETCSDEDCNIREQYWIDKFKSNDPELGYNIAKGGKGNPGLEVSESTKEKLRLRNKGFSKKAREAKVIAATGVRVSAKVAELNRERGLEISKTVLQYSMVGELLNEFPSIIEASRVTNTDRRTIQRQLNGEYTMNGSSRSISNMKFIWKLK